MSSRDCPKCCGNLFLEKDEFKDRYLHCLQCGYDRPLVRLAPLKLVSQGCRMGTAPEGRPPLPKAAPECGSRVLRRQARGHPLTINGRKGSKYSWA